MSTKTVTIDELIANASHIDSSEIALLKKATEFAKEKHKGCERYSGDPCYTHGLEVGNILATFGMNANVIAAGILHDTIDDTETTEKELQTTFNKEIAFYVDAVSQLGSIRYRGFNSYVKSLQKLFVATSKDFRVLIIKLADRLHNMRTLSYLPIEHKRKRIAEESRRIYAPLADRLGLGALKAELEELSFKESNPEIYKEVAAKITKRKGDKEIAEATKILIEHLEKEGIKDFSVSSRIKTVYSTYMKVQASGHSIDSILDINALRILVHSRKDAYIVLGLVHSKWKTLPGTFDDYISLPKPSGYQALHTTIFIGSKIFEIQITTYEMYEFSTFGPAVHFKYKDKRHGIEGIGSELFNTLLPSTKKSKTWAEQLASIYKGDDADVSVADLEADFLQTRIFVFTPKGDVIDLPKGATVIDFAFAIHSDMGNHLEGAWINSQYKKLNTVLEDGDLVELKISKRNTINERWLRDVKTSKARSLIRRSTKKNS